MALFRFISELDAHVSETITNSSFKNILGLKKPH